MRLPNYEFLVKNYSPNTKMSSDELSQRIGGGVGSWIGNTCVLRISVAFNYIGNRWLPYFDGSNDGFFSTPSLIANFKKQVHDDAVNKIHNLPEFYHTKYETTFGRDNKRYLYRLDDLYYYLCQRYKKATISVGKTINEAGKKPLSYEKDILLFQHKIKGHRGIICFFRQFKDANGHFTFWDGSKCLDNGDKYFKDENVYGIFLWTC